MDIIKEISSVLSLIISLATVITMIYGFKKFLTKPRDTLAERVAALETKQKDTENRLEKGNERFHEQDDTNELLFRSIFALISFEVQYCMTEGKPLSDDLKKANSDLHDYLARK